jgi:hypothetical protein
MKTKEEEFWNWFSKNEENLYNIEHEDTGLFEELTNQLLNVNEGLTFEFCQSEEGEKKEFYVSADGMKDCFPAVIDLVKKAPKFLKWNIRAFRQRMNNDEVFIEINSVELSYDDLFFRYTNDYDKIGLEIHVRGFKDNRDYISGIFILLDALLGEYDVATQISFIEWLQLDEEKKSDLSPFIDLRSLVNNQKAMKN